MNERAASDEIGDLTRELAVKHGLALDRSDPTLVLQRLNPVEGAKK